MRFILYLFALLILAQPVGAQCVDIPSCKGAEVEARLRGAQYAKETAAAMPTPMPRPTKTPMPPTQTYTPVPPTETATPIPATQTAVPTVRPSETVVIVPTVEPRAVEVVKVEPQWVRVAATAVGVPLFLYLVFWAIKRFRLMM